jgi:CHAT domain-containing protein/tetratricopeptide (TPR) repeat protein
MLYRASARLLALSLAMLLISCRESGPEHLIEEAWESSPSLDLRIGNAQKDQRKLYRENVSRHASDALVQAEAEIAKRWSAESEDPHYLDLRGRAELLAMSYNAAIQTLSHGLDINPTSVTFKIDLATAYVERADISHQARFYGRALELLSSALEQAPNDPVALFNHAITCERMFFYRQALEDWERYLELRDSSAWEDEARRHAEMLIGILHRHRVAAEEQLLSAETIVKRTLASEPSVLNTLDHRIEDYSELALRKWLVAEFQSHTGAPPPATSEALRVLAEIARTRHGDDLLQDLLATHRSFHSAMGFRALSKAIEDNESGNADQALTDARRAVLSFQRSGSVAGLARSRLEYIYALHRMSLGTECLKEAEGLKPLVAGRKYRWLDAQLDLEEAVCSNIASELWRIRPELKKALFLTQEAKYDALHLRALNLAASTSWMLNGDTSEAWDEDRAGLELYWSGSFGALRAYNIYEDLALMSEQASDAHLSYILQKEALEADGELQDPWRHSMTHFLVSKSAKILQKNSEWEQELGIASSLFSALPDNKLTRLYTAYCDIELAELRGRSRQYERGLDLLSAVAPSIKSIQNPALHLAYKVTLAEILAHAGRLHEAEGVLRNAIAEGQRSAHSFRHDEERLEWERNLGSAYKHLIRVEWDEGDREGALDVLDAYHALGDIEPVEGFNSRLSLVPRSGHAQDRFRVASGEALIAYAIFDDGVAIWLRNEHTTISQFSKVSREQLKSSARRFLEQCSDPQSNPAALQRNAKALYRWLVSPVADHLSSSNTLVFQPDAFLSDIPVQAFVSPAGDYLGQHFQIVLSPTFGRQSRFGDRRAITRFTSAVIVASSVASTDHGLLPLPDAKDEATAVAKMFENPELLLDGNITLFRVKQAIMRAEVLHFAGHALLTKRGVSLLLQTDKGSARLDIADLRKLIRGGHLQLVVLSACSTGSKDFEFSTVQPNMPTALSYSGVSRTIATQWNVDSRATRILMTQFYLSLLKGNPVSEAMRISWLEIKGNKETSHPYYWAAFSVYGRE